MAYGRKTGGRDFQPGNPGRPPLPEDLKQARKLLRDDFERISHGLLQLSKTKLQEVMKDPDTPALELLVASIIAKGVSGGDQHRTEFLLDRLIGPVPKAVEISDPDGQPFRPFANLTPDQQTEKIAQLDIYIKNFGNTSKTVVPSGGEDPKG